MRSQLPHGLSVVGKECGRIAQQPFVPRERRRVVGDRNSREQVEIRGRNHASCSFLFTIRSDQASWYDPLHPETTSSPFSSSCSDKRRHLPLSNARIGKLSKEEVCSPDQTSPGFRAHAILAFSSLQFTRNRWKKKNQESRELESQEMSDQGNTLPPL